MLPVLDFDPILGPASLIRAVAALGTIYSIRDRDIIVDEEGYRYEVGANYWTQLGYQLSTIREEA
jgi:hypothetical protein